MRMKFAVADLIATVNKRRERIEKAHEREAARYEKFITTARPLVIARLREYADELERGDTELALDHRYLGRRGQEYVTSVRLDVPRVKYMSKPRLDVGSEKYALSALNATNSDTITLSPEEYAWYVVEEENPE